MAPDDIEANPAIRPDAAWTYRAGVAHRPMLAFMKGITMQPETQDPTPTPEEEQELIEQARHEAQERVAELHLEEGYRPDRKVHRNSPSPEDKA